MEHHHHALLSREPKQTIRDDQKTKTTTGGVELEQRSIDVATKMEKPAKKKQPDDRHQKRKSVTKRSKQMPAKKQHQHKGRLETKHLDKLTYCRKKS